MRHTVRVRRAVWGGRLPGNGLHWWAACALVAAACSAGSSRQSTLPPPGACGPIVWAAPETLRTPEGWAVFVEHPQVVATESGTALIGSWGAEVDSMPRALTAGFVMANDGKVRSVPIPGEPERWGAPRAAPGRDGRVTVVWVPEDSSRRNASAIQVAELGTVGWMAPSSIELATPVDWSPVSASGLLPAGDALRMVIPAALGEDHGAVLVRRIDSQWLTTPLRIERLSYARLAAIGADSLVLAYVAGAEPDGNTLFVRRFDADGDSIGPRIRVSEPGAGPVYDPELESAGDSLLYLVWAVQDSTGLVDRLALATSADRGRSWQAQVGARVPGGFDLLSAATDPRGRLHVVARGERDGQPQPMHLIWTGAGWRTSTIPPAPGVTSAGNPFMLFGRDGTMRVIWGAAGYDGQRLPAPVSMVSVGRERCSPDSAPALSDLLHGTVPELADVSVPRRHHESAVVLSTGLGTHFSVRGAAWPRAGSQSDLRGRNAFISGSEADPGARRVRHRDPRVRGPPSHAARADRGAAASRRGRRLDHDRRYRVLRVGWRLLPRGRHRRQHLGPEDDR